MANCQVCSVPDEEKPMCFKGTDYCSEDHRKQLESDDRWPALTKALQMAVETDRNLPVNRVEFREGDEVVGRIDL